MLLAHRVPAILCACIRTQCFPLTSPFGTGADKSGWRGDVDGVGDSAAVASPGGCCLCLLVRPAVRALAYLVHPMGLQWRPIRPMPFSEAAAAVDQHQHQQRRRYCSVSSPSSEAAAAAKPSTAAGLAVDVNAAVELATSVWQQTAKHLLARAKNSRDGGRGGDNSVGGGSGRVGLAAAAAMVTDEEEDLAVNAVAALCGILCQTEKNESCCNSACSSAHDHSVVGIPAAAAAAPFCGQFVAPRGVTGKGDGLDETRSAALRVLLHACRASPGIAHAIAAFNRGAAVEVLLARLCLPSVADTGPNVSEHMFVRLGQLFAAAATNYVRTEPCGRDGKRRQLFFALCCFATRSCSQR